MLIKSWAPIFVKFGRYISTLGYVVWGGVWGGADREEVQVWETAGRVVELCITGEECMEVAKRVAIFVEKKEYREGGDVEHGVA